LYAIWQEMTEKENNLLAVFEERVRELTQLCDDRKRCIENLKDSLNKNDEKRRQAEQNAEVFQAKYENLLAARKLAEDENEFQNVRKRVNKLVREVDTCIALLNE